MEAAGDMYGVMKATEAAFKTYKAGLGLGLLPRPLRIQNKGLAADGQADIPDPESGKIKFQDKIGSGFIHIHQGAIFMFIVDVTQFKRMQQAADLTDVTTENFLMKRLFARKSRHMATCLMYGGWKQNPPVKM
jgi:hypothetical protein